MWKTERKAVRWVLRTGRGYLPLCLFVEIFGLLTPYINIYISAEIVNEIVGAREKERLIFLVAAAVASNLVIGLARNILRHLLMLLAVKLQQREEMSFTEKFMALRYADLENPAVLNMRRKIQSSSFIDKHGIYSFIDSIVSLVNKAANLVLSVGLSWYLFRTIFQNLHYHPWLWTTVMLLGLIVLSIALGNRLEKKKGERSRELTDSMMLVNRISSGNNPYNKGKDIRLYRLDVPIMEEEQHRLELNTGGYERYRKFLFVYGIPGSFLNPAINACIYFLVYLGIAGGFFPIGSIMKYAALINRAINALQGLFGTAATMRANRPYLEEYLSFFELPEEASFGGGGITETAEAVPEGGVAKTEEFVSEGGALKTEEFVSGGDSVLAYSDIPKAVVSGQEDSVKEAVFEFRHVWFRYPGAETYALKDVNLCFCLGGKVAVVGLNGSGKTTFIKLLTGMYQPTKGEILVNGRNIQQYDMEEYRKLFSIVFQDFTLFPFTLGQNVASGLSYDQTRVREVLAQADFGERLAELPDGLETYLYKYFDENGVEISGGEAQKIAIARALYKDSPMLVLDEPTAALDVTAEFQMYSLIRKSVEDKGVLFISHRLSVCQIVDEILVFENGNIVQRGTHKKLLETENGLYSRMWKAQAEVYVD